MRHIGPSLLAAGLLISWAGAAPPAILTIEGGDVSLLVSSATAGQELAPVVDQSSSALKYRKLSAEPTMKVTVATDLASPLFTLKAEAVNVGDGNPTAEIVLGTTAQDLITNISTQTFVTSCLRYTSVALVSDGVGTDTHTVTYTIVAE